MERIIIRKLLLKSCIKAPINRAFYHRVSKLFPPASGDTILFKKGTEAYNSPKLMEVAGLTMDIDNGLVCVLPLGMRALDKLKKVIIKYMNQFGAQRIALPFLTSSSLWQKSGRLESAGSEVGKFRDRNGKSYVLSPTYEEAVAELMHRLHLLPHSHLPISLYQISSKFRDEMRPKASLIRAREFVMKDLYTFDVDMQNAIDTYNNVGKIYEEIFQTLKLEVIKARASPGPIGGLTSHEYHIIVEKGDDTLFRCCYCSEVFNKEILTKEHKCLKCDGKLEPLRGLEVGHTFLLGETYSKPMSVRFYNKQGKPELLQMGCYGIGITRLLAACLEVGCDSRLEWPDVIVPFKVCIIPPKKGSKEERISSSWSTYLEQTVRTLPGYEDEVIVDDRIKLSVGKRLAHTKFLGFPLIIVIGKESILSRPLFELHDRRHADVLSLTQLEVMNYLSSVV